MKILAIETSCDETSVALIENGAILANEVASQISLHEEYGGVVPELATREHLRNLVPVSRAAFRRSRLEPDQLDAVATTRGPGLPNALVVGYQFGQAAAFALNRPFLGVHHHEAHLYSPWIGGEPLRADFKRFEPNVSLIVSGGHTLLVHLDGLLEHRVLGSTVDDAAGECFDKVAKLIGLGYPGGPQLDRLAEGGDPEAFHFPRPMLKESHFDFSFSGLKTSVRYFLEKRPGLLETSQSLQDLCASVQAAIIEVLVTKTIRAAKAMEVGLVTASGGVTCNRGLRQGMEEATRKVGLKLQMADKGLCTDNAAMVGILAEIGLCRGRDATHLDSEVIPNWALEDLVEGSSVSRPLRAVWQ